MDERQLRDEILRLEGELTKARRALEEATSGRTLTFEVRSIGDPAKAQELSDELRDLPGVVQVKTVSAELDTAIYSLSIDEEAFDMSSLLDRSRLIYADKARVSIEVTG